MSKTLRHLAGAAALAATAMMFGTTAQADGVKVGTLTCYQASGWGFIFGSSKSLHCNYSNGNSAVEHYTGRISKFGVDIGYTGSAVIVWEVFAPHSGVAHGSLQGDYVGGQASAAVGAGVGANALVGGLDRSFTLQPLSLQGETGLNVAGGIGAMSLKSAP
jgi:Protein of unknown function (DUF992)